MVYWQPFDPTVANSLLATTGHRLPIVYRQPLTQRLQMVYWQPFDPTAANSLLAITNSTVADGLLATSDPTDVNGLLATTGPKVTNGLLATIDPTHTITTTEPTTANAIWGSAFKQTVLSAWIAAPV